MTIEITQKHIDKSLTLRKEQGYRADITLCCPAAVAFSEKYGREMRVGFITVSNGDDCRTRYQVSHTLTREIHNYDATGSFTPGTYEYTESNR